MLDLETYKFIDNNSLEYSIIEDYKEVILFVNKYVVDDFMQMLSDNCGSFLSDWNLKAIIRDGYLAVEMSDLFEYHNIELQKVFAKK